MTTSTLPEMIAAVKAYALENYNHGGWDIVVEAYTDDEIAATINEGDFDGNRIETVAAAIAYLGEIAGLQNERRQDVASTADWFDGTLDYNGTLDEV